MKKVLIVEDEMIIAEMHKDIVQAGGNSIAGVAATSKEALKLFKKHNPDLILMDIYLADDVDGIDTMKIIRKESQVPVIYITGNSDFKTKSRAEQTNYAAFLNKPAEPQVLMQAINELATEN